jgi:hypothetical protein
MWPPCRPGWYVPFSIDSLCAPCPGGYYCANGSISACDERTPNWWSSPLSSSIAACTVPPTQPIGTVACPPLSDTSAMPSKQMCRAWFYSYLISGVMTSALPCPKNFYCAARSVLPIRCPDPVCTTMGAMQIAATCPLNSMSAPLNPCATCTVFPSANAYFIRGGSCDFCCSAGYYYIAASVTCAKQPASVNCADGYYAPQYPECTVGTLPCLPCPGAPQGTVVATGAAAAIIRMVNMPTLYGAAATCIYFCRPGYGAMMGYVLWNSSGCTPCPPGASGSAGTCTNCSKSAGYYTTEYAATACRSCGNYGYVDKGGCACVGGSIISSTYTQPLAYQCTACPPGAASNATACSMCPPGKVRLGAPRLMLKADT